MPLPGKPRGRGEFRPAHPSRSIGLGLERIGILALENRRISILVLIALSIASLIFTTQIRFDDDIVATYRSNHPAYLDYSRFLEHSDFAGDDILVVTTSSAALDAAEFNLLRELHISLALVENVDAVISVFSLRQIQTGGTVGARLVPGNLTSSELPSVLKAIKGSRQSATRLLSNNGQAMLMVVVPRSGAMSRTELRSLVTDIDMVVSDFQDANLSTVSTGQQKLRFEISDAIVQDQLLFNGGGAVLALLLGLLVFRNWRLSLLAFAPAGIAMLWTIGFAGVAGIPITVITNVVPVLVLVVAFADSVHLTLGLARSDSALSPRSRIFRQIKDIGPACALTSITTGFAILTLALTDYSSLTQLAFFGCAAILISFLSTITVFPIVAGLIFKHDNQYKPGVGPVAMLQVPVRLTHFVLRRSGTLSATGAVALAAAFVMVINLTPQFTVYENVPRNSPTRQAGIEAEALFGGVFNLWIEMETEAGIPVSSKAGWASLVRVHNALERAVDGAGVTSLLTIAQALGRHSTPLKSADLAEFPASVASRLGAPDGNIARLVVLVPDPLFSQKNQEMFDKLMKAAEEAGATRVTGTPVLARNIGTDMVSRLNLSILAAAILSIGIVVFAFRNLTLLPAVALSNLIPVLLSGACLQLLSDGNATIPTGLAMTVAFGIAVDDTIHFLNHLRLEQKSGMPFAQAVSRTICNVGHVLIVTTLILIAGIGLTVFSQFDTVRLFGSMMILILSLALIADLLFLPAALLKLDSWRAKK